MRHIMYICFVYISCRDLRNLKHINIAGNTLTTITGLLFSDIISLDSLDISRNNLVDFPFLGVMFGLRHLNASFNQITNVPENVFVGEFTLQMIYYI